MQKNILARAVILIFLPQIIYADYLIAHLQLITSFMHDKKRKITMITVKHRFIERSNFNAQIYLNKKLIHTLWLRNVSNEQKSLQK